MAADVGQLLHVDAVLLAEATQVAAQLRSLEVPTADTEVDVVALREHPAVPARNDGELEHHPAPVAAARDGSVAKVPLERDTVDDVTRQAECAGGDAVRAVGTDEGSGHDGRAGDANLRVALDVDARPVPELRSSLDGALDQEGIEPPALRHHRDGPIPALEGPPVLQATLDARDDILDDGLHGEGQLAQGAVRETAAARLVAREPGLVDQQHARVRAREVV